MTGKCVRVHPAEATWSFCESLCAITPNYSFLYCQQEGRGRVGRGSSCESVSGGKGAQYLVDLQDFSSLLSSVAALGGRSVLVLGAVILREGNQQLEATEGTEDV